VYNRQIHLFVGSRAELIAHLTEKWGKHSAKRIAKDACGQMVWFKAPSKYEGVKTRIYYLWTVQFNNTPNDIGTLAHEAFHIATTILCDLGVDTNDVDGSESVAYYMESIFVQSLTELLSVRTSVDYSAQSP